VTLLDTANDYAKRALAPKVPSWTYRPPMPPWVWTRKRKEGEKHKERFEPTYDRIGLMVLQRAYCSCGGWVGPWHEGQVPQTDHRRHYDEMTSQAFNDARAEWEAGGCQR
jgi:hypothetical protein